MNHLCHEYFMTLINKLFSINHKIFHKETEFKEFTNLSGDENF